MVFPDPEVENLPGDEDNWEWSYEGCRDISLEQFRELNLVLPGADIHLNNLTKLNANMISEIFNFIPYSTKKGIDDDSDYLMIKSYYYND